MASLTVPLAAVGQHGSHGTQGWEWSGSEQAGQGQDGRRGQDGEFPSPGGRGGDLHVTLGYDADRPGLVQVVGEDSLAGGRWEVGGPQSLLLDCHGGNGGAGGVGENGQNGGDGWNGKDASPGRNGTDGGPGGKGGNGGRGTDGAIGGEGGNAYITVGEDDLDTLVGVHWDVLGGLGGPPGTHGYGGDGGSGGKGGKSCSWEDEVPVQYEQDGHVYSGYQKRSQYNRGGSGGAGGRAGYRPTDELYPGRNGPAGSGQIIVLYRDGTSASYASRFILEVVSFDVQDENDDGINEPGEHLIVSNIVMKNTGQMPSPRGTGLQILIRASKWLDPVMVPLEVPTEIQPGTSVAVPGVLRALIKNETIAREKGTLLHAKETVTLRAFSPRLQRDIPEFAGGCEVLYQYPLFMTAPKYLDCVAKGDTVKFFWTVQNISNKAQGRGSLLGNETGTRLSDPGGMFELQRAKAETPHDIMDMIDVLEPGERMPIVVEFRVSELVNEFTTGSLLVTLMLSDPQSGNQRVVVAFDLRIQISPPYRHNPASRFLLVVNAQSPNAFVVELINFIQHGLHLPVDVFNISLSGSLKTVDTRQDVLTNYMGKSIIILGNTMTYFQDSTREPWEMVDVGQASALARGGTSFLVVSPTNIASFKGFAHLVSTPGSGPAANLASGETINSVKEAVQKLATATPASKNLIIPVKKTLLRSLDKTLMSTAETAQEQLADRFPLRRFLVTPLEADESTTAGGKTKAKGGAITIIEGLPQDAKLIASLQQTLTSGQQTPVVTDYTISMLAHTFSFRDQCAMFWNIAGRNTAHGLNTRVVYVGEKLAHLRLGQGAVGVSEGEQLVSSQFCNSIAWSITTQLASELSHFCAGSGAGSSSALLPQLPLLQHFVSSAPTTLPSSVGPSTSIFYPLINILGHIRGVTSPLGFGASLGQHLTGTGQRRKKLFAMVVDQVAEPLMKLCEPSADPGAKASTTSSLLKRTKTKKSTDGATTTVISKDKTAAKELLDVEKDSKKQLADIKKNSPQLSRVARTHELACLGLADLVRTPGLRFVDMMILSQTPVVAVTTAEGGSSGSKDSKPQTVTVLTVDEYAKLRVQLTHRQARLAEDVAFSFARLAEMVTKRER
ncbi:hypothetical protein B0H63DRAFT_560930 [Podospora didyma]|uniref:DUF7932 domain-containing protein n=1 Tax=Podospora didyma TaxID=330526 RepID=A0AAE0NGR0_9PEZI|nr:hypothetical protein B0H63DRAFT_560930 [Podospora didyma]